MRDLNDDIYREPFNAEIKQIVHEFGALLKPMIDTIDRFGLKTRFLRKHKMAVTRFYNTLLLSEIQYGTSPESSETVQKKSG